MSPRRKTGKRRFFTTSEVARYCGVSTDGVLRWIRARKLRAFSTPGGHHRVSEEDFRLFLEQYDIPVDESFFGPSTVRRRTVLVVDADSEVRGLVTRLLQELDPSVRVHEAAGGYQAGLRIGELRPDLVVLDLMLPKMDGLELLRTLRENPGTQAIKVLAMSGSNGPILRQAYQAGAEICLTKPLRPVTFRNEAARLLGLEIAMEPQPDGSTGA